MAIHGIFFGSMELTDLIESHEESSANRLNAQAVPKRHGILISEVPVYGPRQVRMTGKIYGTGVDPVTDARTQLRALEFGLGRTRKALSLFTDRFYNAYKNSFSWGYVPGSAMQVIQFSVEFVCDDPFEYATTPPANDVATLTTGDTAIDVTNNIYREEFVINNNGNEFVYPVITVAPTGANVLLNAVVRNLTIGRLWQYTGTIAIGTSLIVDCGNFTVENNGEDDLAGWSGHFIWLQAGANTIQIEGTKNATYTFAKNERYI